MEKRNVSQNEISDKYLFSNHRQRLKSHFKGEIESINRPGLPTLVCSGRLTISKVLLKMEKLNSKLTKQNEPDYKDIPECFISFSQNDPACILHQADNVIRNMMKKCSNLIPNLLYNFFSWGTDNKKFVSFSLSDDLCHTKDDLTVIALCHIALSQGNTTFTPPSLASAVNWQLLESFHSLGSCASYEEVRRFETSIAKAELVSKARQCLWQWIDSCIYRQF